MSTNESPEEIEARAAKLESEAQQLRLSAEQRRKEQKNVSSGIKFEHSPPTAEDLENLINEKRNDSSSQP